MLIEEYVPNILDIATLGNVSEDIIPSLDDTYSLGSSTKKWKELYISGGTIHIGPDQKLRLHADGGIEVGNRIHLKSESGVSGSVCFYTGTNPPAHPTEYRLWMDNSGKIHMLHPNANPNTHINDEIVKNSDLSNHVSDADAHHDNLSDGLDITPATVITTGDITVGGGTLNIGSDATITNTGSSILTTNAALIISGNMHFQKLSTNSAGTTLAVRVLTESINRFKIDSSGELEWSPGSVNYDTKLYRSAINTLKTDGDFFAVGNIETQGTLKTDQYLYLGSDVLLYRDEGDVLRTNDTFRVFEIQIVNNGTILAERSSATTAIGTKITGDSYWGLVIDSDGRFQWGPGSSGVDTNLFRESANLLRTNDSFQVDATLYLRDSAIGVYSQADSYLDLFADGGIRIGDSSGGAPTNYMNILPDGEVRLVGTARVALKDIISSFNTVKGASAPGDVNIQVGTTATMLERVLSFSKNTQNDIYFTHHVPVDMDNTVELEFILMWKPGAAWTSGNYLWKVEYIVKNEDDDLTTVASTIISADITPSNANDLIETHYSATINADAHQTISLHFYRDIAGDDADDVGLVRFFEFKRVVDRLGLTT